MIKTIQIMFLNQIIIVEFQLMVSHNMLNLFGYLSKKELKNKKWKT